VSENSKKFLKNFAEDLKAHETLSPEQFRTVFATLSTEGTDAQKGAFLMLLYALDHPSHTITYITEAARVLRKTMNPVSAPTGAIDIVGTGGDGMSTFNISTAAAFVVAGAGVSVAKHGNRAVSSLSGASDVLTALGVNLNVSRDVTERAIKEAHVGFLWAPNHHPTMKAWAHVRNELGLRTIFNLLGPICNPANVKRQVIGVYAKEWVRPIADVMKTLGSEHVWVVHGSDGLDELTTTGTSYVAELKNGSITEFEITPEDAGLRRAKPLELSGGNAEYNAAALRHILSHKRTDVSLNYSGYRDIVELNAAAALIVAGKADDLRGGVALARLSIDRPCDNSVTGAALTALEKLVAITNE
jgi:anthranilate phosphoribosyltransferase